MLSHLQGSVNNMGVSGQISAHLQPISQHEIRYNRNEKEDMQKAIEYLYEFKRKLDELHPNCINVIEHLLQKPVRY